ncbi:MAG: ribbon-helix-helix protein, CopG family [Clostridiales bacterium]|nr:ribbon-helix-helix protein, CopG family [Clostridiales bacterium]
MRIKPNRKRTIEFKVMLSPEEAALLKSIADKSGLSRSEVLRSLLTNRPIAQYREGSVTPSHFGKTIRKDGS